MAIKVISSRLVFITDSIINVHFFQSNNMQILKSLSLMKALQMSRFAALLTTCAYYGNFNLQYTMKAQTGSRGISLLFL